MSDWKVPYIEKTNTTLGLLMMQCDEVLYAKVLFARHGVIVLYAITLAVCNH